uniref:Uncharacterized protein n=1 Tax=Amphimedon queenslandica TaxID=400682 RepID=A0A1X7T9N8_AMPQE
RDPNSTLGNICLGFYLRKYSIHMCCMYICIYEGIDINIIM